MAGGQTAPQFKISTLNDFVLLGSEDVISFQLNSFDQTAFWMLQSSSNGEDWDDLAYLNGGRGIVGFGVSFERRAISGQGFDQMLFRAVKLAVEDKTYREYLDGLLRWREKGYEDYSFVVRSSQGMISYEARYTVVGGEVTEVEKISAFPDFIDPPSELTIADLFTRVGSAIAQDAVIIDVDWSPEMGFPKRGFIDLFLELADEEQSWTIVEFIPTSPDSIEFLAARQRWRDAGLSNYSFVVETIGQLGVLKVRHTVVNGVATTAEVLAQPAIPVNNPKPETMEDYFDEIARAFEVGAESVSVDYDAINGHPTRASIDFEAFIADEEKYWNIKEFSNLD